MVRWDAGTTSTLWCTVTFISLVIGCCSSTEVTDFSYVVFPIQVKKQYHVPLDQIRSFTELSLCGWVEHNPVFVDRQSSFITLKDDQGNQPFRLYLLQSGVYFSAAGAVSDDVTLPAPNRYWYHLCVTWESATGSYRIYREGNVQLRGFGLAKGQVLEGISTLTIGNLGSYVFSGRISDFHLYSKVLDASQVKEISCLHKCLDCLPAVSWSDIEREVKREDDIYYDENPCYLAPPTGLSLELDAPTSILASWSASTFSLQFQWYLIMVRPVEDNDQTTIPTIITTLTDHYSIKDLEEWVLYKVQVARKSRCGYKSWSEALTIRTLAVPDPIEGLEVTNKTNSSISIVWEPITSHQISSYRLIIREKLKGSASTNKGVLPDILTYTFKKLQPNTWYIIKVAEYSALGIGGYSTINAKTQSNSVPELLVKVDVEIQPYFLVKIAWHLVDSDFTNLLYKIAIKKEEKKGKRVLRKQTYQANSGVLVVDGANTPYIEIRTSLQSLVIEGLLKHTPYHVTVSLCPDPISECQNSSNSTRFILCQVEHYYYQQSYNSEHVIEETDINEIMSDITEGCEAAVKYNYKSSSITPTSFSGSITFYHEDGSNVVPGEMWYHLLQAQHQTISLEKGTFSLESFQFTPVNTKGYCPSETHREKGRGNFTWPYVRDGSDVTLPCNMTRPDPGNTTRRACRGGGWDGDGDYTECPYTEDTSGKLKSLVDTEITNVEVAMAVSQALSAVTQGKMNEESIGLAANAIGKIVAAAENPDIPYNTQVAENLVGALGNIQSLDSTQLSSAESASSSQTIVTNIETYCLRLTGEDTTLLNVASEDLKLAVVKPEGDTGIYIETEVDSADKMSISYRDKVHRETLLEHIGVEVPASLLKSNSNVLTVLYKDKSLFQSAQRPLSEDVDGEYNIPTVSLSIDSVEHNTPLNEHLTFSLRFKKTSKTAVCVYWDTKAKDWSEDGVEVVYRDKTNLICRTSHLTSFSALLLPEQNDLILSILTQIGASISILCLFTTVLLLYIVRCVRECLSTKIHINFSLALCLSLLLFMINANTSHRGLYCKILAGLTHYFFLCAFLWMSVEAVGLYRAVVLVFTSGSNNLFFGWACVVAWGLPLVVVVVLVALVNLEVYQMHVNLGMCWLSPQWMYGSFFGPLVLVFLFNSVVFFRVLWTIIRNKNSKAKGVEKKNQRLVELRIIFSIMTLLGLTWVFGILQIAVPHKVIEYLFALTNTLQGVAVFVFYCLFNSNIRTALWRVAHGRPINIESTSSTLNHRNHKKKMKMSIKKAANKKLSIVKLHIDGNPFAFSFGSQTADGKSRLRKLDKKNWEKLRKHDIQHPNGNLQGTNGAVIEILHQTTCTKTLDRSSVRTMMTSLTICASPTSSPTPPRSLSRVSSLPRSSPESDSPARARKTRNASPDIDSTSNDVLIKHSDSSDHFEDNMDRKSKEGVVDSKDIFIIDKDSASSCTSTCIDEIESQMELAPCQSLSALSHEHKQETSQMDDPGRV